MARRPKKPTTHHITKVVNSPIIQSGLFPPPLFIPQQVTLDTKKAQQSHLLAVADSAVARPALQDELGNATIVVMNKELKKVLERAQGWPEEAQDKLLWVACEIERWLNEDCRAELEEWRVR